MGVDWRFDTLQGQLGDGIGVLVKLVRVGLYPVSHLAVFVEHVASHFRRDGCGGVPSNGLQNAPHPQQGCLQAVTGGPPGAVAFLGDASAPNAVIPGPVDPFADGRDHETIVRLAVLENDRVLVGAGPTSDQRFCAWIIHLKGVFICLGPAFFPHRPRDRPIGTADDTVVTGGGHDLGVRRRKRYMILR